MMTPVSISLISYFPLLKSCVHENLLDCGLDQINFGKKKGSLLMNEDTNYRVGGFPESCTTFISRAFLFKSSAFMM